MPHTLDGNTIPMALVKLNKHTDGGDQSSFSDASTYNQLVLTWRGAGTVPTEAELQTALDDLETDAAGTYAGGVRSERNRLLAEADVWCARHRDQTDNSETTTLSGAQMTELLNYKEALRDMPADIAAAQNGRGTFLAPVYPTLTFDPETGA